MYRLMQLSQTTIPVAASYTHLFAHTRTHNRVEFLTDFPIGDDAEVISSLQVHPQGWCALSRNVSSGEKSEVCSRVKSRVTSIIVLINLIDVLFRSGPVFTTYKNARHPAMWNKSMRERRVA